MSGKSDDEQPLDVNKIKEDDELVEELRAGYTPDGPLPKMLGAWRDQVRPEDHRERR